MNTENTNTTRTPLFLAKEKLSKQGGKSEIAMILLDYLEERFSEQDSKIDALKNDMDEAFQHFDKNIDTLNKNIIKAVNNTFQINQSINILSQNIKTIDQNMKNKDIAIRGIIEKRIGK